jgi:D-erythrulose 4-kinase
MDLRAREARVTSILNDPRDFAREALAGLCSVHRRLLRLAPGGVLRATDTPKGKVALVIGGGSGHYPAFAGYVGPGLADAAVAGDIFASPSTRSVAHIGRLADRGGGVLLGFGNYAGDVLNFGAAAARLAGEGIDARILLVTDDVASAPVETPWLRRGVAGDVTVFKIAGAAAELGLGIDDVETWARLANARTVSFGVAFDGCTLPGAHGPLFRVPEGQMAIGLGIHGEPGVAEIPVATARDLAAMLVERLVAERPADASGRVAVLLNGLGATKYEELFVLWSAVEEALVRHGLTPVAPEVGELVTSLDMAGCSLTLTWLDHGLEQLWLAPAETPAFRRGTGFDAEPAPALDVSERGEPPVTPAGPDGQRAGRCMAALIASIAQTLAAAADQLGALDAIAGDGDHGQCMSRGAEAAADAAARAADAGAGAASVLARAADAWGDRAGGASGALWGIALRAWSSVLDDDGIPGALQIVAGARAALDAVMALGGARPGDKTLVDAFDPFVRTLEEDLGQGGDLGHAWAIAAARATEAAAATAPLSPRLGRARPLAARSVGHPDAGATSLALVARCVEEVLVPR